jgi:hypothetical protein
MWPPDLHVQKMQKACRPALTVFRVQEWTSGSPEDARAIDMGSCDVGIGAW